MPPYRTSPEDSSLSHFDLGQALELRGACLGELEPIEEDRGCTGQHIHGNLPCTGAPDPEPSKCGHGIVTLLDS